MSLIEIRNITKSYFLGSTEVAALRGLNLELEKADFVALLGPSGSGKSTLLNLVGLIDVPTSGQIILNGQDTTHLDERERAVVRRNHIGFIFQSFNLIPVLTALENVMLPLTLRGETKRRAASHARLRLQEVGLDRFAEHRPDQLSGGQRQRVAIARSLVTSPKIVIADEPTANIDAATGKEVIELMRTMNRRDGVTFLFSTHDPRLIDKVDRLIRITDGSVQNSGLN